MASWSLPPLKDVEQSCSFPPPSSQSTLSPCPTTNARKDGWISQHLAHIIQSNNVKFTMQSKAVQTYDSEAVTKHNSQPITGRHRDADNMYRRDQTMAETEKVSSKLKIKQQSKQLSSIKRKIDKLEEDFKTKVGYRPSYADMMNNAEMKHLMAQQLRLKNEIKEIKDCSKYSKESVNKQSSPLKQKAISFLKEVLDSLFFELEENRKKKNRPYDLNNMTIEQIFDEKKEMQLKLLEFEKEHGHPEGKEEKDLTKALYDRYRMVKRIARRSSSALSREALTELETIPENDEIPLTLASPTYRIILEVPSSNCASPSSKILGLDTTIPSNKHDMDLPNFTSHASNVINDSWHHMSRYELLEIQSKVREEKKNYRRSVKDFEKLFVAQTGRHVSREDKEPIENTYKLYKITKSKLKLIDALLSKM